MSDTPNVVSVENMDLEQIASDFSEQLEDLQGAIEATGEAKALAQRVSKKGFWQTLGGGINGSTDKELAECVNQLGGSLETTQKIVQLMLQIGQAKNIHLKSLHRVIVDKICSLEDNTGDLDLNQQSAGAATLAIAHKVKEQLEEKLVHAERIQQHEDNISKLTQFSVEKDVLDAQQSESLEKLNQQNQEKDLLDGEQSRLINELQEIANKKVSLDDQQSQELRQIRVDLTRLEEQIKGQAAVISMLKEDRGQGVLRILSFSALGLSVAAVILALVL